MSLRIVKIHFILFNSSTKFLFFLKIFSNLSILGVLIIGVESLFLALPRHPRSKLFCN